MNNMLLLFFCSIITANIHAQTLPEVIGHDISFYTKMGDNFFALGNYNSAIAAFQKTRLTADTHFKIAKSYEALGASKKAIVHFEMALEKEATNVLMQYNYGKLLYSLGNSNKAKRIFALLAENQPDNPNFPYYQGLLAEKENDTLAIYFYKEALLDDVHHLNATYRLAKIFTEKRKFYEAEAFIKKGLEADNASTRFLILQGLSHFHMKSYQEAIRCFEKLIANKHGTERLWEKLAISYAKSYQYKKASTSFELLITTYDDKNASYFYTLGSCLVALDEIEKGRNALLIAVQLQQVSLDKEYVTLAITYKNEKDFKKTMDYLSLAMTENPQNEYAQYQLAVAADNYFKDTKAVLVYYERFIENFGEQSIFYPLAFTRSNDLKENIHLNKD